MTTVNVTLSQQDLAEFLEENEEWMEAYRAELEDRLADSFGMAIVEIDPNALSDKVNFDGDLGNDDDEARVGHIMNLMVNNWEWLPQ